MNARAQHTPLACAALVAASGLLALTGCQQDRRKMSIDQQIAAEMSRYRNEQRQQAEQADNARAELAQQLAALSADLEATATRLDDLERTLAEWDVEAMRASLASTADDLAQLRGEHVGLQYRTTKQFDEIGLIHANLEQSDNDIRKLVAGSVTSAERRGEEARAQLRNDLSERLEEGRSTVISEFRTLAQQVAADASRAALAMQLIREVLADEQSAINQYAERLDTALARIDEQFGADGAQDAAAEAAATFDEAARLHREFLAHRYRTDLLDGAVLAYRRGLALQPDMANMHFELGKLLRIANRSDEAAPHLRYYAQNGADPQRQQQARTWLGDQ